MARHDWWNQCMLPRNFMLGRNSKYRNISLMITQDQCMLQLK